MKRNTFLVLLLMQLLMPVMAFSATTFWDSDNRIEYTINDDGKSVTLTGHEDNISGELIIPSTIENDGTTYNVTSIETQAFYSCCGFTGSLNIPESVTSIGNYAFGYCSGFTGSLNIPEEVTSIGEKAFAGCSGFTGDLTIPMGVTNIGNETFKGCTGFTGVLTIPMGVTSIGASAFYNCNGLTGSLTIPKGVTSIGASAFAGCTGLTGDLIIPDGVTTIGPSAFNSCSGLSGRLTIPKGVTSIGASAFAGCTGLTGDLIIPDGVTTIGASAFNSCTGFNGKIYLSADLTQIYEWTFKGCENLTGDLIIPDNVTSINFNAFLDCSGLSGNLTLPSNLQELGDYAFKNCKNLIGDLTIPEGVTSIGYEAFNVCSKLDGTLTIPKGVTSVGDFAFCGCSQITAIIALDKEPTNVNSSTFEDMFQVNTLAVPIGCADAYSAATGWSTFEDEIVEGTPYTDGMFTYLINSENMTANLYRADSSIQGEINIPETVTIDGVNYDVTSISSYAFYSRQGLTGTLTIPASITEIGNYVFAYCRNLTEIVVLRAEPAKAGYNCFNEISSNIELRVPEGSFSAYKSASGWDDVDTIIDYDEVYTQGIFTFNLYNSNKSAILSACNATATGEINIPSSVTANGTEYSLTAIGYEAFNALENLTGNLIIPEGVKSIMARAFYNCRGFKGSLQLPESLESIDDEAFNECTGLTGDLIIPNMVNFIGDKAFCNCSSFNGRLQISENIETISDKAFSNCSKLTGELVIPNGVKNIGSSAFCDCSKFDGTLVIPESIVNIGFSAFKNCSNIIEVEALNKKPAIAATFSFSQMEKVKWLRVPAGSCDLYNSATSWKTFNTIIDSQRYTVDWYSFNLDTVNKTATLYACSKEATGEIEIPEYIIVDDVKYKLTAIGDEAFSELPNITGNLTIPEGVETIGNKAFYNCTGLDGTLIIPESVNSIAAEAFCGSSNISKIVALGTTPAVAASDCFRYLTDVKVVRVPEGCCEAYETATEWSKYSTEIVDYDETYVDGLFTYHISNDNKIAKLYMCDTSAKGDIEIPAKVNVDGVDYNVTTICDHAFYNLYNLTGKLVIPEGITTIGISAFFNCDGFEGALTLPKSLTNIGNGAFNSCDKITEVIALGKTPAKADIYSFTDMDSAKWLHVPTGCVDVYNTATGWKEFNTIIDAETYTEWWFTYTLNTATKTANLFVCDPSASGEIDIPAKITVNNIDYTLTSIGDNAFNRLNALTGNLVIPNGVTSIGDNAFEGCSGFKGTLTLPTDLKTIGALAFGGCTFLTGDLVIPDGVTSIGGNAFDGCAFFNNFLILPKELTTIGDNAFHGCTGLKVVISYNSEPAKAGINTFSRMSTDAVLHVPGDCVEIYTNAIGWNYFSGRITDNSKKYTDSQLTYELYGYNSNYIAEVIACDGSNGTEINIPKSVTDKETNITYNVTKIDSEVFTNCSNITIIKIESETPPTASKTSFDGLNPDAVLFVPTAKSVEDYMQAEGWKNFKQIIFKPTIGYFTFDIDKTTKTATLDKCNATESINNIVIPSKITVDGVDYTVVTIGDSSFSNRNNLTGELNIPNTVTRIEKMAFYRCTGFTGNLNIPETVTSIGEQAFSGCSRFTGDLNIHNRVTTIGDNAFNSCSGFDGTLTLPSEITSIGASAFYGCRKLNGTLNLPINLNTIGASAFRGCSGFTGELILPKNLNTIGEYAFRGCWGFTGELILPESLTSIGDYAFYDCKKLSGSINIPEGVTTIGNYLFYNCTGLDGTLTLPDNLTSIGNYAFYKCGSLTGPLNIPEGVTYIGSSAFYNCKGFTGELILPNGLTTINNSAFWHCDGLTGELVIPSGVTSIENSAFQGCKFTGDLVIPKGITSIGAYAFGWCPNFDGALILPAGLTSIGDKTFIDCKKLKKIIVQSATPAQTGYSTFRNATAKLYVPYGSRNAYAESSWKDYPDLDITEYTNEIVAEKDKPKTLTDDTVVSKITIKDGGEINAEGNDNLYILDKLVVEREFTYEDGKRCSQQWFSLALPFAGIANSTLVEKLVGTEYVPAVCGVDYVTFNYNGKSRADNGTSELGENWDMLDTEGSALGELIQFAETGTHKYRFTSPNAVEAKTALQTGRTGSTYFEDIAEDANEGWNLAPAGKTYSTDAYDIYNGLASIQLYNSATGNFDTQIISDMDVLKPGTAFAVKLGSEYTATNGTLGSSDAAAEVEHYTFELIAEDGTMLDRIYLFDGSSESKYRLGKMSALDPQAAQMAISIDDKSYCTYSTLASELDKSYTVTLANTAGATLVMKAAGSETVTVDGAATTINTPIEVTDGEIEIKIGSATTGVDTLNGTTRVTGSYGTIKISGAAAATTYAITTTTGVTTYGTTTAATTKVAKPAGIYIVKIANQTTKVIVK